MNINNIFRELMILQPHIKCLVDCKELPHPSYLLDVGIDIGIAISYQLQERLDGSLLAQRWIHADSIAVLTNLDPFP